MTRIEDRINAHQDRVAEGTAKWERDTPPKIKEWCRLQITIANDKITRLKKDLPDKYPMGVRVR